MLTHVRLLTLPSSLLQVCFTPSRSWPRASPRLGEGDSCPGRARRPACWCETQTQAACPWGREGRRPCCLGSWGSSCWTERPVFCRQSPSLVLVGPQVWAAEPRWPEGPALKHRTHFRLCLFIRKLLLLSKVNYRVRDSLGKCFVSRDSEK